MTEQKKHEFTAASLDTGAYAAAISNRWQWIGAIAGSIIPATIIAFTPTRSGFGGFIQKIGKPASMALSSTVGWVAGWGAGLVGGEIHGHRKANKMQSDIVGMLGENQGLTRENLVLKEQLSAQSEQLIALQGESKRFADRIQSRGERGNYTAEHSSRLAEHGSHAGAQAAEKEQTAHAGAGVAA